jgi:hypothetical protein
LAAAWPKRKSSGIGKCVEALVRISTTEKGIPMPAKYAPSPAPAINRAPPAHAPANGPVKTLRIGRLKAAVWENSSDDRTFYNVTFARTYMGDDKKLRDTDSFGRDDLLVLSKLADQAHSFVCERMSGQRPEEQG